MTLLSILLFSAAVSIRAATDADPRATDLALASAAGHPVRVEREIHVMGTLLRVQVEARDAVSGAAAIERAFEAVRRLDGVLSTWREDAELARLNAAPVGEAISLSPQLLSLLLEARAWSRETAGAFDPGVGALVDAWDLRGRGRRPAADELAAALAATGIAGLVLDPTTGTARRTRERAWTDSGGFGKGAALRAAGMALAEVGITSAILDFGGQVLAVGGPEGADAWSVAVAHPSRRSEPAAFLELHGRSASTSSQSERFVDIGGQRFGHVLDPRTGLPVPAWGSVTVVASDPLAADALSTALLVMGEERARRWAEQRPELGVLLLADGEPRLSAWWNAALEREGLILVPGVRALAGGPPLS